MVKATRLVIHKLDAVLDIIFFIWAAKLRVACQGNFVLILEILWTFSSWLWSSASCPQLSHSCVSWGWFHRSTLLQIQPLPRPWRENVLCCSVLCWLQVMENGNLLICVMRKFKGLSDFLRLDTRHKQAIWTWFYPVYVFSTFSRLASFSRFSSWPQDGCQQYWFKLSLKNVSLCPSILSKILRHTLTKQSEERRN